MQQNYDVLQAQEGSLHKAVQDKFISVIEKENAVAFER
jgi:hypothetical protein